MQVQLLQKGFLWTFLPARPAFFNPDPATLLALEFFSLEELVDDYLSGVLKQGKETTKYEGQTEPLPGTKFHRGPHCRIIQRRFFIF